MICRLVLQLSGWILWEIRMIYCPTFAHRRFFVNELEDFESITLCLHSNGQKDWWSSKVEGPKGEYWTVEMNQIAG